MGWSRKLRTQIHLNDGCRLTTLSQVAARLLAIPDVGLRTAHWGETIKLLGAAAEDDATEETLAGAEAQLVIAFEIDGLIGQPVVEKKAAASQPAR
jgi:hypothetical protein